MQLTLPQSAYVGRKIPKTKFYEQLKARIDLKNLFVQQIESITWAYNLSPRTIHLDAANGIEEIQIFEIQLRQREYSLDILKAIDRAIPYPILYRLCYKQESKLVMAYKERNEINDNLSVVKSYHETKWQSSFSDIEKNQYLKFDILQGLDLGAVHEHILRNIVLSDTQILVRNNKALDQLSLKMLLEKKVRIETLQKECGKLATKIAKEKQANRKVELNIELQSKIKEFEAEKVI